MKVEIIYKNKDLEIVDIEEFSLKEYCHLLSQKTLGLLYQIEDLMDGKNEFSDIRKYIFNLAGNMERLPDNLIDDVQDTKMKTLDKSIFDFLKRRNS